MGRLPGILCVARGFRDFCMSTIVTLRIFAPASNVLFCLYGLLAHIYPVLLLHMILLAINLLKLYRLRYH